jgi:hypothetical protein
MFGPKQYHYIVDGLNEEKARTLRQGLSIVPVIRTAQVNVSRSTVEVEASRDVADEVKVACDVAGVHFRTRLRR